MFDSHDVPGLTVESHRHFDALLARAEPLPEMRTAVVAPEETNSLRGALLAAEHTLIKPILIGDESRIHSTAKELEMSLDTVEIIHCESHIEAAQLAVTMVNEGRAAGDHERPSAHRRSVAPDTAQQRRSENRPSPQPYLCHGCAGAEPSADGHGCSHQHRARSADQGRYRAERPSIWRSASGSTRPRSGSCQRWKPSTRRSRRHSTPPRCRKWQNAARSPAASSTGHWPWTTPSACLLARTKGLKSLVAGKAEILVVPNLESGNMLAKELSFIAHAEAAGVVIGARCPIILNSRSDSDKSRLASCAVAALHAARLRGGVS